MSKEAGTPCLHAGMPLFVTGLAFAAVGASGQAAFGYIAVGLLIPGALLSIGGALSRHRQQ
ncbi:hypothetical protein D3C76_1713430 [compost metagenome]|jgi:hypothetical protein